MSGPAARRNPRATSSADNPPSAGIHHADPASPRRSAARTHHRRSACWRRTEQPPVGTPAEACRIAAADPACGRATPVNLLLLLSHAIEEYDQVRLLSSLGYDVFSLGGYIDPAHPHDRKRPSLPEAPFHPELREVVDSLGTEDNLEMAKQRLPTSLLEWGDAILVHAYERRWIAGQWPRLREYVRRGKRVIWRTIGQSAATNELAMAPLKEEGLEIVRYSPRERNIPGFAGEDALIRFYKDPEEWSGWVGDDPRVINVSAGLVQRGEFTNWEFWEAATAGLPRMAVGPGSEAIGGAGEVSLCEMKSWLRRARAYLYTGTQPASYTLGLIEALMTGIPVVSIGPKWHHMLPYGPDLFEGHELSLLCSDDPAQARRYLRDLLIDQDAARQLSERQRQRAIRLFRKERIGAGWKAYLG